MKGLWKKEEKIRGKRERDLDDLNLNRLVCLWPHEAGADGSHHLVDEKPLVRHIRLDICPVGIE